MPIAPKVACRCGKLDCQEHSAKANRKQYDSARADDPLRKIYSTARWQRQRAFVLSRDPLCVIGVKALKENRPHDALCVQRYGVAMPSLHVDHVISMRDGGDPWDPSNLQGLCTEDHARKHGKEAHGG